MTRDMLIKLLADEHEPRRYIDDDAGRCRCGTEFEDHDEWVEHVADLILLGFAR